MSDYKKIEYFNVNIITTTDFSVTYNVKYWIWLE